MLSYANAAPIVAAQFWTVAIAGVGFLSLGLTGLVAPRIAGALFGAEPNGALAFVRAMGARNIGISLLALILLALDQRLSLVALSASAALIALLDFWIVSRATNFTKAIKHLCYTVALTALAVWLSLGVQS